jgi:hypothetical protein
MDGVFVDDYRAEANEDDWHNVKDAKKRKQIQDRLAQRARRMYSSLFSHVTRGVVSIIPFDSLCHA